MSAEQFLQWQEREHAVDAHVAAGEIAVHDDVNDFLVHVDALARAAASEIRSGC